jgi:hypothetical protein
MKVDSLDNLFCILYDCKKYIRKDEAHEQLSY